VPKGVGARTVQGTRAAVRTVIRYRDGVLRGNGASQLDGYMEDLATDRIYRLMIAQRVRHRDLVRIEDAQGRNVKHTPELVTQLFDEELDRLLRELPATAGEEERERFRRARELSEAMIVNGEFDPV
jgi:malate synthase